MSSNDKVEMLLVGEWGEVNRRKFAANGFSVGDKDVVNAPKADLFADWATLAWRIENWLGDSLYVPEEFVEDIFVFGGGNKERNPSSLKCICFSKDSICESVNGAVRLVEQARQLLKRIQCTDAALVLLATDSNPISLDDDDAILFDEVTHSGNYFGDDGAARISALKNRISVKRRFVSSLPRFLRHSLSRSAFIFVVGLVVAGVAGGLSAKLGEELFTRVYWLPNFLAAASLIAAYAAYRIIRRRRRGQR